MAVRAVGIDLVDVSRLVAALQRTHGLSDRLFTTHEQDRLAGVRAAEVPATDLGGVDSRGAESWSESVAALFAAKEAVMKALGRGIDSLAFTEVEIDLAADNTTVLLSGRAATRAAEMGILAWTVDVEVIDGPVGPVVAAEVVAEAAVATVASR